MPLDPGDGLGGNCKGACIKLELPDERIAELG